VPPESKINRLRVTAAFSATAGRTYACRDVLAGCPRNVPVPVSKFQRRDLMAHLAGRPRPARPPGSKDRHAAPQRAIGRRLDPGDCAVISGPSTRWENLYGRVLDGEVRNELC